MIITGFLLGVSFGLLFSVFLDELQAYIKKLVKLEISQAVAIVAVDMPPEKKAKVVA